MFFDARLMGSANFAAIVQDKLVLKSLQCIKVILFLLIKKYNLKKNFKFDKTISIFEGLSPAKFLISSIL